MLYHAMLEAALRQTTPNKVGVAYIIRTMLYHIHILGPWGTPQQATAGPGRTPACGALLSWTTSSPTGTLQTTEMEM